MERAQSPAPQGRSMMPQSSRPAATRLQQDACSDCPGPGAPQALGGGGSFGSTTECHMHRPPPWSPPPEPTPWLPRERRPVAPGSGGRSPPSEATPSSPGGVSDLGGGSHTPTITPACRTTARHPVSGTEQRGTKRPSELVCQEETPTAPRGGESTPPNHTRATTLHGPEWLPQTVAGSPADPRRKLSALPGSAVTPSHKGGWVPGESQCHPCLPEGRVCCRRASGQWGRAPRNAPSPAQLSGAATGHRDSKTHKCLAHQLPWFRSNLPCVTSRKTNPVLPAP